MATANPTAPSMPVAKQGYAGFQNNKRVVITGAKNALQTQLAQMLPRTMVLGMVRRMQSPH